MKGSENISKLKLKMIKIVSKRCNTTFSPQPWKIFDSAKILKYTTKENRKNTALQKQTSPSKVKYTISSIHHLHSGKGGVHSQ